MYSSLTIRSGHMSVIDLCIYYYINDYNRYGHYYDGIIWKRAAHKIQVRNVGASQIHRAYIWAGLLLSIQGRRMPTKRMEL